MVFVIHNETQILGVEETSDALDRYPPGCKATLLPHSPPSLLHIKSNWRVVDGELVPRIIASTAITPDIATVGESVTVSVRIYNLLPEEERDAVRFKLGPDFIEIPLRPDPIVSGCRYGEVTYVPASKGSHVLELYDWPEADCLLRVLTVV